MEVSEELGERVEEFAIGGDRMPDGESVMEKLGCLLP